ncbi:rubredoxin [Pedobacter glucosidilyticus]|nr:rubredoxin domain-containing protein [Pedobacter glucosidilyticus]KHJ37608.1 rubredoxin [Pedobacter glucosidilyticus]
MAMEAHIIKINLPGGIVSTGDLHEILTIAEQCNVANVRFGNRQQILFKVTATELEDLKDRFMVHDIPYEIDQDEFPNIVSSYVTEEIFQTSLWLTEGVYKDILDGFNHQPKLKINIVDYYQNLIPFFTGNLNFIASETNNFWYLYIRFPKTNHMFCWPSLIYSEDIAALSLVLEDYIHQDFSNDEIKINEEDIYAQVLKNNNFHQQEIQKPLIHTDFQLPYYEGLNKYNENKLWLGIYRRHEEYSIAFLKAVCEICQSTRIGQLYTTSWKSIVIKNINIKDRYYWSKLLDKFRINIRHAANELNWQVEDLCEEALKLKIELVKQFEEADLRTYRLCFAIKTKPKTGLFSAIVIRKRNSKNNKGEELYELLYTKNFNPNAKEYITFHDGVVLKQLSSKLIEICNLFYQSKENGIENSETTKEQPKQTEQHSVYQCKNCLTIYDERYGDPAQEIAPKTSFNSLDSYFCPVCDAPKQDFVEIQLTKQQFV